MATVYLCIGTQKTGTTFLQEFMRRNEKALKKQGYCYPKFELGINGMKNRNAYFLVHHSKLGNKEACQKEEAEFKRIAYSKIKELSKEFPNIVLSDENIWYGCKRKGFWTEVLNEFHNIGCEVKVVVYLRRQDQVIESLWKQRLKGMACDTFSFSEFCERGSGWFPLDYFQHCTNIAEAVGRENLTVRIYERGQFEGAEQSLLSDYLQTINVELTKDFDRGKTGANYSLNGNFIEMKRIMNGVPRYKQMHNFMRGPIVAASVHQEQMEPLENTSEFSYEDLVKFMSRFDESNRKVAVEFLGREEGVLFREPLKELPVWEVKQETMYRDMMVFMTEMFCEQQKQIEMLTQKLNDLSKNVNSVNGEMKNTQKELKSINSSLILRGYRKVKNAIKK